MDTREGESLPLERNREAAPFGDWGLSWGLAPGRTRGKHRTDGGTWPSPNARLLKTGSRAEAETLLSLRWTKDHPRRSPPPRRLPSLMSKDSEAEKMRPTNASVPRP